MALLREEWLALDRPKSWDGLPSPIDAHLTDAPALPAIERLPELSRRCPPRPARASSGCSRSASTWHTPIRHPRWRPGSTQHFGSVDAVRQPARDPGPRPRHPRRHGLRSLRVRRPIDGRRTDRRRRSHQSPPRSAISSAPSQDETPAATWGRVAGRTPPAAPTPRLRCEPRGCSSSTRTIHLPSTPAEVQRLVLDASGPSRPARRPDRRPLPVRLELPVAGRRRRSSTATPRCCWDTTATTPASSAGGGTPRLTRSDGGSATSTTWWRRTATSGSRSSSERATLIASLAPVQGARAVAGGAARASTTSTRASGPSVGRTVAAYRDALGVRAFNLALLARRRSASRGRSSRPTCASSIGATPLVRPRTSPPWSCSRRSVVGQRPVRGDRRPAGSALAGSHRRPCSIGPCSSCDATRSPAGGRRSSRTAPSSTARSPCRRPRSRAATAATATTPPPTRGDDRPPRDAAQQRIPSHRLEQGERGADVDRRRSRRRAGSWEILVGPRGHHERLADASPQLALAMLRTLRDTMRELGSQPRPIGEDGQPRR